MIKKFLIKVNGNQYEVEVEEVKSETAHHYHAVHEHNVKPAAPVQPAAAAQPAAQAQPAPAAAPAPAAKAPSGGAVGSQKINAPMPGTILKVNVNPGDQVAKGAVLLILEAMKMENEIVAPADGKIATINVSKGSAVNAGDLMVSME